MLRWDSIKEDSTIADTTKVLLLCELGRSLRYDYPDSSRYFNRMALELSLKNDFSKGESIALNNMGTGYYINADYEKALAYTLKALAINDSIGFLEGMSFSLNSLGTIYLMFEQYQKSLDHHFRSIDIAIQTNNQIRLVSNYFNIAIVHDNLHNYDSAMKWLDKALAISQAIDDHLHVSMIYSRRGEVLYNQKRFLAAIDEYHKVLNSTDYQSTWETCELAGYQDNHSFNSLVFFRLTTADTSQFFR
jgi:tetratricopeptide (TPR) repeat protein